MQARSIYQYECCKCSFSFLTVLFTSTAAFLSIMSYTLFLELVVEHQKYFNTTAGTQFPNVFKNCNSSENMLKGEFFISGFFTVIAAILFIISAIAMILHYYKQKKVMLRQSITMLISALIGSICNILVIKMSSACNLLFTEIFSFILLTVESLMVLSIITIVIKSKYKKTNRLIIYQEMEMRNRN